MSVFYFIKTGFFLLVMLFAIIITIWMIRSRKQRERDGSVDPIMDMVNQMGGIGSEFDKMVLDVNPKYRLKKDPQRIYWILLFEILSFLVVIVSMIRKMMELGYIPDIHGKSEWVFIEATILLLGGIALLQFRKIKRKIRIRENNMEIEGTVVDVVNGYATAMHGYGRLIVEYYDPYELCKKRIVLGQDFKLKKYPIGKKYTLSYSRSMHEAYDLCNNRLEGRKDIYFTFIGIIMCLLAVLCILLALILI